MKRFAPSHLQRYSTDRKCIYHLNKKLQCAAVTFSLTPLFTLKRMFMETLKPSVAAPAQESLNELILSRKKFLFKQVFAPQVIQSTTFWEELTCVGFNPREQRLEGIVSIKQSTGYGGTLCNPTSKEYIRFFVDFKDGSGFQDMGYTSFSPCDIMDNPPEAQHPIMYMSQMRIHDEKYRKFLDCNKAVIPTVRGILSWNVIPSSNPNYIPAYGNVKDVSVQLQRKSIIFWKEIFDLLKVKPNLDFLQLLPQNEAIMLQQPPTPPVEALYKTYRASEVPDHRIFYSTVGSLVAGKSDFKKATTFNMNEVAKLKVDLNNLADLLAKDENTADVTYEEVRCIGMNTSNDTLGAVIHVKKPSGFSGNMCQKGSMEHVAFWADWDNNGNFDEYLGTASVEVHDISNIPADGLYYNVALPIDVSKHLRRCSSPNRVKMRAVLSWEALPSTTNPNVLNFWGNRVDSIVQIRPGNGTGVQSKLTFVGGVDRDDIDPAHYLYNYSAVFPTKDNNRPWGGAVRFQGIIDRNGFNGTIKYKLMYKKFGAADSDYATVSTSEVIQMFDFGTFTETNDVQIAPDGWFTYKQNPAIGLYNEDNHLAWWNTGGLTDGTYTVKLLYTDEFAIEQTGDEFSMIICNKPMTVSPTANTAVDINFDIDEVIDGGDCHSYPKASPNINGHVRATHPYFALWSIQLEPSSHTHSALPSPTGREYNALADNGDSNAGWTLDTTPLDPCGYTVSLLARTRVILNSSTYFPLYGPKAVGFAVLS